ncbi:MAG: Smr/MutS family protein [Bacteroidales bacterium]|nr:Smr/MutS family protein [Bacteroidales bacterium]MDD4217196.1 Smr/MutS family protein [Bacteroidales bacterium]MDY0140972.1 Smr/MutS family protein [Bacteroidales bacterium]
MIYPQNFENKIGFDLIRNKIKASCLGNAAKLLVDEMEFSNNICSIRTSLDEIQEMITIYNLNDTYPVKAYPETHNIISKLKVEGSSLQVSDLIDIRILLDNSKALIAFFKKDDKNEFPNLKNKIKDLVFPKYLSDRIDTVLSKNGTIKDNASPGLKEIRKNLLASKSSVSKSLNNILGKIRDSGWVSRDLSATLVNGRLVLPIESTFKRKIDGLIHDESASGKTSYIEPREVVELNNTIRELEFEENREIQKILFDITNEFRPYQEELKLIANMVTELDLLRAKAAFSVSIEAIKPAIDENPQLDIFNAKHPLLYLALKKEKREIVPTSFKLDNDNRILIISGPNAGGKSVSLKTAALISYMVQCGLPVPVGGQSVIGIFDNIFMDIGDQQSLENDLSTYSSHLTNMKYFLKNANDKTLILIDEFGSGTDPVIGGTIAEAILEELNTKNCFGVITTHYSNLKIIASNTPGIQNAAMLIDQNKMEPTFILEIGMPGSSYAIEIAQRIGLPQNIIEKTKEKAGSDQTNMDKFLRRVLRDKKYWERKRQQIRKQEKSLEEIIEKNIIELETLKQKKKQIIGSAQKEAEQLLKDVNKQIENTIRTIKESDADKEKTKIARKEIEEYKKDFKVKAESDNDEIARKYEHYKKKQEERKARQAKSEDSDDIEQTKKLEFVKIDKTAIHIGSKVCIKGQEVIGEVTDIGEKNAVVSYGNMYTSIAINKLQKVSEDEYKKQNRSAKGLHFNYNEKVLNFKPYIDVRGERVDEAIAKITELVDEAVMLGFKELKILHGKGNGILRKNIRDFLRTISQVQNCYDEEVQFGGTGITIVKLK